MQSLSLIFTDSESLIFRQKTKLLVATLDVSGLPVQGAGARQSMRGQRLPKFYHLTCPMHAQPSFPLLDWEPRRHGTRSSPASTPSSLSSVVEFSILPAAPLFRRRAVICLPRTKHNRGYYLATAAATTITLPPLLHESTDTVLATLASPAGLQVQL